MTVGYEESAPPVPAHASSVASTDDHDPGVLAQRGWSSHAESCAPKIAALAALSTLAAPEPIASVSYTSHGNVLVVEGALGDAARRAARSLAERMPVTLLVADEPAANDGKLTAWSGRVEALAGHLGQFDATLAELRTERTQGAKRMQARFDLVLDFSAAPLMDHRQPPQGYFKAPSDEAALARVLGEIEEAVGEFEKPRFFAYRENLCAHQRSEIVGCNACIEICSTRAIAPDGDQVKVDPHLCMGCGACATVCPSGAMSYQFPRGSERGARMKQLLSAYRAAGGGEACIVFHNGGDGRAVLAEAARSGRGLPARALPLEEWHVASIGLDALLPAIAFGASQVVVLSAGSEDAEYLEALREQMAIGAAILSGLGYAGSHFALIEARTSDALAAAFDALAPAAGVAVPAAFQVSNDKRTAIEFAVDHLAKHAPRPAEVIALPAFAPFGEVRVDRDKCTMCMSCVGACPESALMDGVDQPLLKFVERNCVQCGLCERTCPEEAISLSARLLRGERAREARVLNETQPFHCVSCGKPFGTRNVVEAMLGRLAGHSMFTQPEALRRLQMCGDCRVVDMMSSKNEVTVHTLGDRS